MHLTNQISRNNFLSFLWHSTFLALAQSFMDIDTIMPSMILEAGGNGVHIGIFTAIVLGGSSISQLVFVPYLNNSHSKKKHLLAGVNIRVLSLFGIAVLLYFSTSLKGNMVIAMIFLLITVFSLSGAFANISYTDIFGKSINAESRKSFLSIKQVIAGIGILLSALIARNILTKYSYPVNYSFMFFLAAMVLGIASLGFWKIKEVVASGFKIKNLKDYSAAVLLEFRTNKKLKYYLGFINTLGLSIMILPFIILFAQETFETGKIETGNFLLAKVSGVVTAGIILTPISKLIKYKFLMYLASLLALLIPLFVMIIHSASYLFLVFLIGGIVFSIYSISMKGVLLEISDNKNRALYTGIAGAGSIIPIIFSLFGGWIIQQYGFTGFFAVFILIILSSLYFIYKLDCIK